MAGHWRSRAYRAGIEHARELMRAAEYAAAYRLLGELLEDVPPPLPPTPLPPRPCELEDCGAWWQPLRPHGRYCSEKCRRRAARRRART